MSNSSSDADLIALCRQGNRVAQNLLFERFKGRVLGICLRYAERDIAKDIQQDVFIKLFQKVIHESEIVSLEKIIVRITINCCIDFFRKRKSESRMLRDYYSLSNEPSKTVLPLEAEELNRLIISIPEQYRIVFNLYIIEGYSHSEISKLLEMEESTSRSYLSRAKNILEKKLISLGYKIDFYAKHVG